MHALGKRAWGNPSRVRISYPPQECTLVRGTVPLYFQCFQRISLCHESERGARIRAFSTLIGNFLFYAKLYAMPIERSKLNNSLKLIISIVISELAGVIGSIFTVSAIPAWYATLAKPVLNPPAWIFAPVWTTLYLLMGIAAFLVWRKGWEQKEVRIALSIFGVQLVLNALWSVVFFGLHSPAWALINILALWIAIAWTIMAFYKISRPAAYLLVLYILWVSFAAYLNYSIWILNR